MIFSWHLFFPFVLWLFSFTAMLPMLYLFKQYLLVFFAGSCRKVISSGLLAGTPICLWQMIKFTGSLLWTLSWSCFSYLEWWPWSCSALYIEISPGTINLRLKKKPRRKLVGSLFMEMCSAHQLTLTYSVSMLALVSSSLVCCWLPWCLLSWVSFLHQTVEDWWLRCCSFGSWWGCLLDMLLPDSIRCLKDQNGRASPWRLLSCFQELLLVFSSSWMLLYGGRNHQVLSLSPQCLPWCFFGSVSRFHLSLLGAILVSRNLPLRLQWRPTKSRDRSQSRLGTWTLPSPFLLAGFFHSEQFSLSYFSSSLQSGFTSFTTSSASFSSCSLSSSSLVRRLQSCCATSSSAVRITCGGGGPILLQDHLPSISSCMLGSTSLPSCRLLNWCQAFCTSATCFWPHSLSSCSLAQLVSVPACGSRDWFTHLWRLTRRRVAIHPASKSSVWLLWRIVRRGSESTLYFADFQENLYRSS